MKRTKGIGPEAAISEAMAATSSGWPRLTRNSTRDIKKRKSDTHSRRVDFTHLILCQKWRRVALEAGLSQGRIRRNPGAGFAPAHPFDRSSSRHCVASKLVPFYAWHKRNVEHRRHSPERAEVTRRNGARMTGQIAHQAQGFRSLWERKSRRGAGKSLARRSDFPLWGVRGI